MKALPSSLLIQLSLWLAAPAVAIAATAAQPTAAAPATPPPLLPPASTRPPGEAPLSTPLSIEQAVQVGLARNPQMTASQAAMAAAERNYRSLAAFPSINLALTHVNGSSSAPTLNGTTSDTFADFGDTLDTSGQRRFQAASAKSQFAAARYTLEETKLTLTQQIRDAYWSLAAARAQARIARESLQDAQQVYQLTNTQFQAGASPQVDVIRSSIDRANVQQSEVTARGAESSALTAFNVLLARPATAPVELADQFSEASVIPARSEGASGGATETEPRPSGSGPSGSDVASSLPGGPLPDGRGSDLQSLTQRAIQHRPLVLAAKEQVRAADYAEKQARAARLPDLSVDYQRSLEQPIDSVLLGISLPLLDFGSVRQSIKAAEEAKRQAQAQEQQAEQQVVQQVAQAYTDYTQARDLAASYQTDILSPSGTLLTAAQLGYKQGATGILPVIDALTTLRAARTGYINSLLALYKAQDEIQAAVGEAPVSVAQKS